MEACRICLEPSAAEELISPCNCSGTQKFIHQSCLTKWQQTMMNNILADPEIYTLAKVTHCSVCKSAYDSRPPTDHWHIIQHLLPLLSLIQKYWYTIAFLLLAFALFSGLILIPFLLNALLIVFIVVGLSYYKGIRPRILATNSGVRLGFIRVGQPIQGLSAGVILNATEVIAHGIFERAKVLITNYSPTEGAVGFILNKRACNRYLDTEEHMVYYIGGPVSPQSRHVIHDSPNVRNAEKVAEGVYLGGFVQEIQQGAKKVMMLGYCGWAPCQLDGEIRAGVWNVSGIASARDVFS